MDLACTTGQSYMSVLHPPSGSSLEPFPVRNENDVLHLSDMLNGILQLHSFKICVTLKFYLVFIVPLKNDKRKLYQLHEGTPVK